MIVGAKLDSAIVVQFSVVMFSVRHIVSIRSCSNELQYIKICSRVSGTIVSSVEHSVHLNRSPLILNAVSVTHAYIDSCVGRLSSISLRHCLNFLFDNSSAIIFSLDID